MKKISKLFLNIFFPESCIGCEKFEALLCEECIKNIKKEKKNQNYQNIDWIYYSLSYKNTILKKSLFSLKYRHVREIAKYLSLIVYTDFFKFVEDKIKENNIKNIILLPIPISKKRFIERDYNQSELLIKNIIENIIKEKDIDLNKNLYIDLLLKNKNTIKFAETHSSIERENLIKDAFYINRNYNSDFLKDKIIILIDDITTTGTTFYEARKTLINSGAKKENIFGYALVH